MKTIQKRYKTLIGFWKAVGNCIPMQQVFDGYIRYETKDEKLVRIRYSLADSALKELAELWAQKWSKSYHKRVVEKVMDKSADNSFVQCFYLERYDGRFGIGNSLSGPSHDYCKRMWLKS